MSRLLQYGMRGRGLPFAISALFLLQSINPAGRWCFASVSPEDSPAPFKLFVSDLIRLEPGSPVAEGSGTVQDSYDSGSGKSVVILEDAHGVGEAQESLAALTSYLIREVGIRHVGIEGGEGKLDLTLFRHCPDKARMLELFRQYSRAGMISGVVLAALQDEMETDFEAIEDGALYARAVELFLTSRLDSNPVKTEIDRLLGLLEKAETSWYPARILEIEKLWRDVQRGKNTLEPLLSAIGSEPEIKSYSGLQAIANELRPGRAEDGADRMDALSSLTSRLRRSLSPDVARELEGKWQAFQTSSLDEAAYSEFLKTLCARYNVSPGQRETAVLERNARLIQAMHAPALFHQLEACIRSIRQRSLSTEGARLIDSLYGRLLVYRQLADLQLPQESWQYLENHGAEFTDESLSRDFERLLRAEVSRGRLPQTNYSFRPISGRLGLQNEFYRICERRDQVFVSKIRKSLDAPGVNSVIFLGGGFHSHGLRELLKKAAVSYVVISPRVKSVPDDSAYLQAMNAHVPWESFIDFNRPSVDLYDAFAKGVVAALLASYKPAERSRVLRDWKSALRHRRSDGRPLYAHTSYVKAGTSHTQAAERTNFPELTGAIKNFLRDGGEALMSRRTVLPANAAPGPAGNLMQYTAVPVIGFALPAGVFQTLPRFQKNKPDQEPAAETAQENGDRLDGVVLLSYAAEHAIQDAGSDVAALNRELVRRHRVSVYQFYRSGSGERAAWPGVEHFEKGSIYTIPLPAPDEPLKERKKTVLEPSVSEQFSEIIHRLVKTILFFFAGLDNPAGIWMRQRAEDLMFTMLSPAHIRLAQNLPFFNDRARRILKARDEFLAALQPALAANPGRPVLFVNQDLESLYGLHIMRAVTELRIPSFFQYSRSVRGARSTVPGPEVDIHFFDPSSPSLVRGVFREKHGLDQDSFVVIVPEPVSRQSGQMDLLEAVSTLPREETGSVKILFAGPVEDSLFYGRLIRFIKLHGMERSVVFAESLDQKSRRQAYADSDAALLTAAESRTTKTAAELAAMKVPIIASADGPAAAILPKEALAVVSTMNAAGVRDALKRLVAEPALRVSLGRAGRRFARAHYSMEALARRQARFFGSLLHPDRAASGQTGAARTLRPAMAAARSELRDVEDRDIYPFFKKFIEDLKLHDEEVTLLEDIIASHPPGFSFSRPQMILNLIEILFSPLTNDQLVNAILEFQNVSGVDESLNTYEIQKQRGLMLGYYFAMRIEAGYRKVPSDYRVLTLSLKTKVAAGGASPDALFIERKTGRTLLGEFKSNSPGSSLEKLLKEWPSQMDAYIRTILTAETSALYRPWLFHEPPSGILAGIGDSVIRSGGRGERSPEKEANARRKIEEWYRGRVQNVKAALRGRGVEIRKEYQGDEDYPPLVIEFLDQPRLFAPGLELAQEDPENGFYLNHMAMTPSRWKSIEPILRNLQRQYRYARHADRSQIYQAIQKLDPDFYNRAVADEENGEFDIYQRYLSLGATFEERDKKIQELMSGEAEGGNAEGRSELRLNVDETELEIAVQRSVRDFFRETLNAGEVTAVAIQALQSRMPAGEENRRLFWLKFSARARALVAFLEDGIDRPSLIAEINRPSDPETERLDFILKGDRLFPVLDSRYQARNGDAAPAVHPQARPAFAVTEGLVTASPEGDLRKVLSYSLEDDGSFMLAARSWSPSAASSMNRIVGAASLLAEHPLERISRVDIGDTLDVSRIEKGARQTGSQAEQLMIFVGEGDASVGPLTAVQRERGNIFVIDASILQSVSVAELLKILKRIAAAPVRLRRFYRDELGLSSDAATGITSIGQNFIDRLVDLASEARSIQTSA